MLCVLMCQALAHHHTWCHQLRFSGGTTPSSCTCLTPVEYNKLAAAVCCILSCCALSWHLPNTLCRHHVLSMAACMVAICSTASWDLRGRHSSNAGWEVQPAHSMVGIHLGCIVWDKFRWVCCAFGQHSAVGRCVQMGLFQG